MWPFIGKQAHQVEDLSFLMPAITSQVKSASCGLIYERNQKDLHCRLPV